MIFNREKARKTQKRKDLISSVFSSCLRAFVPSCEKKEACDGQAVSRFPRSLNGSCGEGTNEGFSPCALPAAKLWSNFLARFSRAAFSFSHEGTKARRHEGKKLEDLESFYCLPLLRLFAATLFFTVNF
ncbi:MAG: hypothetical protein PHQ12_03660 [Chthoniobacteraceae bacterium]|nr:hypothetical protein [Chthoniobacteraceae bacterium]